MNGGQVRLFSETVLRITNAQALIRMTSALAFARTDPVEKPFRPGIP